MTEKNSDLTSCESSFISSSTQHAMVGSFCTLRGRTKSNVVMVPRGDRQVPTHDDDVDGTGAASRDQKTGHMTQQEKVESTK